MKQLESLNNELIHLNMVKWMTKSIIGVINKKLTQKTKRGSRRPIRICAENTKLERDKNAVNYKIAFNRDMN